MPDPVPYNVLFRGLLEQGSFTMITCYRLRVREIKVDRGPAHILARSCSVRLRSAKDKSDAMFDVKRMFRDTTVEEVCAKGCDEFDDVKKKLTWAIEKIAGHKSPVVVESARHANSGLAAELGADTLSKLRQVLNRCLAWGRTYHAGMAKGWERAQKPQEENGQ